MTDLKERLERLRKREKGIRKDWEKIDSSSTLSTREKLERLVNSRLGKGSGSVAPPVSPRAGGGAEDSRPFYQEEYRYHLDTDFKGVKLKEFLDLDPRTLQVLIPGSVPHPLPLNRAVFFDTETTGLSGGTGTIPFMMGFGYFENRGFTVKIFVLTDLTREQEFLEAVDQFLSENRFSFTVTYNGKCFDFPLVETRHILRRLRFSLANRPHIDMLYPARRIWRYSHESRRLGYLGEVLLGLSREEDVPGWQIPRCYFDFLRNREPGPMRKVAEHNSMDLVGLCGIMILICRYCGDVEKTMDGGEALGVGRLWESKGYMKEAEICYNHVIRNYPRGEPFRKALDRRARIMKRWKRYREAEKLWLELVSMGDDSGIYRELAILYEHRSQNWNRALEMIERALESENLEPGEAEDFRKRKRRVEQKKQNRHHT